MEKKKLFGLFVFLFLFVFLMAFFGRMLKGPTVSSVLEEHSGTESVRETEDGAEIDFAEADQKIEVYQEILSKAGRGFFAGHPADQQFLVWVEQTYGQKVIDAAREQVEENGERAETESEQETEDFSNEEIEYDQTEEIETTINVTQPVDSQLWREQTGRSMHVLWTEYCGKYGYESYDRKNQKNITCRDENLVTMDFIGDINLDDGWCTMKKYQKTQKLSKCISPELIRELKGADLAMANNEFTFGDKGTPIPEKDYTFRAKEKNIRLLKGLGIDMVSMANNHSFDFGEEGLLYTKSVIEKAGITALGAGEDLEQADEPGYVIANGWKIAIVTATEVERFSNFTREATEDQAGVFKMTDQKYFLQKIREAKAESDFVIAYVHWGQEGKSQNSGEQHEWAEKIVEAGADAIIGGHPHRLQGMEFIGEVPVVYSLGNFWFSDGALFSAVAQVTINDTGRLGVRMIPVLQEGVRSSIISDKEMLTRYYKYFADMSSGLAADTRGKIYNLKSETVSAEKILGALSRSRLEWVQTGMGYSRHNADRDIYGNAIDIVGNMIK